MANQKTIEKKQKVVDEIKDRVVKSNGVFFGGYRGLTVKELSDLRQELRGVSTRVSVFKNLLIKRAVSEMDCKVDDSFFVGPTFLVDVQDDIASAAKILTKFEKKHEALEIKGGLLDDKELTKESVYELSELPSMDELIGKVVGTLKAPINQLVINLSSPIRGLVYTLDAIKLKKTGGENNG